MQPSNVYSFGVFLLELLTRKFPIHATGGDEVVHLYPYAFSIGRNTSTASFPYYLAFNSVY
ncbi:hypothetical protein F3Y22_tig00110814pilonHSYRG00008 [Hibiscus syriacus]|uniref:Uncharacterized protein n=1 Tax=Hibiscus syriacus TaxID=106335 RepID=A0A6A2ZN65_HIBSY|nr:hypothetical protein F3Y22_tig00110814pilonHSYRG00008 [Hibiscus syriacus]